MNKKLLSLIASNHMILYIPKSNQIGVLRMSTPFLINTDFLNAATIQLDNIINDKKFVVYRPPLEFVNNWIINYDRRMWKPRILLKDHKFKKKYHPIDIMMGTDILCRENNPYLPCFDFNNQNIMNMSYFNFEEYIKIQDYYINR